MLEPHQIWPDIQLPRNAILCWDMDALIVWAGSMRSQWCAQLRLPLCIDQHLNIYCSNPDLQPDLMVCHPGMGAPAASATLELLIAHGARNIITVGPCGSLEANLTPGTILIPTRALIDEGVSHHYHPFGVASPHYGLRQRLDEALRPYASTRWQGKIVTTDGLFRETPEEILRWRNNEACAVDMETSALYTIAQFRATVEDPITIASALVISDYAHPPELSGTWQGDTGGIQQSMLIALTAAQSVLELM